MASYISDSFVYLGKPGTVKRDQISFVCGLRELVVKVIMCARCGTDKRIYLQGHPNVDPYAPVVLGHELVAKIVEVGKEVSTLKEGIGYRAGQILSEDYLDFKIGERVTFQSRIARYNSNGLMLIPYPIANLSFQINGGYSEYMKIPETMIRSGSVLRIPDNVTDEEACLVEPAACALESIFASPHPTGMENDGRHIYKAGIKKNGKVCVIGSGTVGMIYSLLAIVENAELVVMVVRSETKKKLVQQILGGRVGVYVSPDVPENNLQDAIKAEHTIVNDLINLTNGTLFDDVITACSSTAAQRLMLKLYTPEGYAVGACFGGTHRSVDGIDLDINHYRAAKTIGTSGCSTACMKTILKWLAEDRISLEGFTSKRHFVLDDDPHEFFTSEADGLKPALYLDYR